MTLFHSRPFLTSLSYPSFHCARPNQPPFFKTTSTQAPARYVKVSPALIRMTATALAGSSLPPEKGSRINAGPRYVYPGCSTLGISAWRLQRWVGRAMPGILQEGEYSYGSGRCMLPYLLGRFVLSWVWGLLLHASRGVAKTPAGRTPRLSDK